MLALLLSLTVAADAPAADPLKPPAIQALGVPKVPAELAERLKQYESTRAATFQGWDPHGDGMLIATRFGATNQLHRVREPGGRREQVTFFAEPVSGGLLPGLPAGDLIASLNPGGSENFQLYLVPAATGKPVLLTDGKSRNQLMGVKKDGSAMLVLSNARNGKDADLLLGDPRKPGSLKMVAQAPEGNGEAWQVSDWTPDGSRALLLKYVSINESIPYVLHVPDGTLSAIPSPTGKPAAFTDLRFSRDGKSVYLAADAWGEFRELAKLDLATGMYERLAPELKGNIEEVAVSEETDLVVFSFNDGGYTRVRGLLPGQPHFPVHVPDGVISGLRFLPPDPGNQGPKNWLERLIKKPSLRPPTTVAGMPLKAPEFLGFTLAKPNSPADVYSTFVSYPPIAIKPETTRWTYSETGGLPASGFRSPELAKFKSFDGLEVPAFVMKPAAAAKDKPGKHPVVIVIHGGPEAQYRPVFSGFGQFLAAELGCAVVNPNVRGSDGYGKTYLKLDNAEKREDSVKDIGALLDWIKTQPDLDADRVAVMGGSYGGYMTLATLMHYSDRLKCGVDIVGIANFTTFLERTAPYRRALRRAEYGDETNPAMRKVFDEISPPTTPTASARR